MTEAAIQTEKSEIRGQLLALVRPRATRAHRLKEIQGCLRYLEGYADDPLRLLDPNGRAGFSEILAVIGEEARRLAGMK
jgi:hypothetical protein